MFILMDTKTFIGKYLKDCSPEEFLGRQYVTVSLNVRTSDSFQKICFDGKALYPHGYECLNYLQNKTKSNRREYKNAYFRQLLGSGVLLGSLIEVGYSQDKIRDIVFLANPHDVKSGHFDYLAEFLKKRYGINCAWYADYRKKNYKELTEKERKEVVNRARISIYETQKKEFISRLNTDFKIRHDFKKMIEMDDKIRILKEIGVYEKGMKKEDINDELDNFLSGS